VVLLVGLSQFTPLLPRAPTRLAPRRPIAVVAATAPICVDQFQRAAGAADNLTALKKAGGWEQAAFVEKGGWAVTPGSNSVESGVTQSCAALLANLK
jgi:hypothetical protein